MKPKSRIAHAFLSQIVREQKIIRLHIVDVFFFFFIPVYEICAISKPIAASLLTLYQNINMYFDNLLVRCKTHFFLFRVINFHFEMTSSQNDHHLPAPYFRGISLSFYILYWLCASDFLLFFGFVAFHIIISIILVSFDTLVQTS